MLNTTINATINGVLFAAAVLITASGQSAAESEVPKNKVEEAYSAAIRDPFDDAILQDYLDTIPSVANAFSEERLYLVEGDMPMTLKEVRAYLTSQGNADKSAEMQQPELRVHVAGGKVACWWRGQRTLRYAVVRASFPSQELYQRTVSDMAAAGGDWQALCGPCAVEFKHAAEHDGITTMQQFGDLAGSDKLRFVVVYNDSGGNFIAAAFFPNDPWNRRIVQIDPSYYSPTLSFPGRGVLRHELGHVLGYRHEHIVGIPGCNREGNDWRPLTPYDPHSVMHYFCGGGGTMKMEFTDLDGRGHHRLYAGP
jgi:hypothetical protein